MRRRSWQEPSLLEGVELFFHLWHCAKFFSVAVLSLLNLYPLLPTDSLGYKAPGYVCVLMPSVMPYLGSRWVAVIPNETDGRLPAFIRSIALS